MSDDTVQVTLSIEEATTILAALRSWQRSHVTEEERRYAMPDLFFDVRPLDGDEIEELCEKING